MADTQTPPSPDERPNADVVLYDGQCNFCRAQMQRLMWWDCQDKLAYLSLHDPKVAERWPDISRDRLLQEMCIIDQQGRRHWGAEAVRYLSRRLRRLWWLAPLMHVPGAMLVGKPIYRFISRNRFRIAGRTEDCDTGACSIHR